MDHSLSSVEHHTLTTLTTHIVTTTSWPMNRDPESECLAPIHSCLPPPPSQPDGQDPPLLLCLFIFSLILSFAVGIGECSYGKCGLLF